MDFPIFNLKMTTETFSFSASILDDINPDKAIPFYIFSTLWKQDRRQCYVMLVFDDITIYIFVKNYFRKPEIPTVVSFLIWNRMIT